MATQNGKIVVEEARLKVRLETAKKNLAHLEFDHLMDMLDYLRDYNEAEIELAAFHIAQEAGWTHEKALKTIVSQHNFGDFPEFQDSDPFELTGLREGLHAINLVKEELSHIESEDREVQSDAVNEDVCTDPEARDARELDYIRWGLSPREAEALVLTEEGFTPSQISKDLGVKPQTVNTHLRRAMNKLARDS